MSLLNFLEYRTYKYNRKKYPKIEPQRYSFVFKNWKEYEKLYQNEVEDENC